MGQWIMLATKPDDLSLTLGTHIVRGKNSTPASLSPDFHMYVVACHACIHAQTHPYNKYNENVEDIKDSKWDDPSG